MLSMATCRSFLNSTGHSFRSLDIPSMDMQGDLRELIGDMGSAVTRNNLNLLVLPCVDAPVPNTVMYVYALSQRHDLDGHKNRVRSTVEGFGYYANEATVVGFVNYKSINAESRAALKEFVLAEYPDRATLVNSRYMVIHPQCDVAVYKFPNNKFLVLTNTFTIEFIETVYAMLWINHDHSTATPEMADALLRGDNDVIVGYINSLIATRVESVAARRFNKFVDKFKGIMVQRSKLEALEHSLNATRDEIARLNNKLLEQYTKRKATLGKILAAQNEVQENVLDDLLLMIKPEDITSFNLENSSDSQIYFTIKSKFVYWDVDDYKIMRDRRDRNNNFLSNYDAMFIGFLDEIFINKSLTLLFDTPLTLYTYNNGGGAVPSISRGDIHDVHEHIANPHIYHYNCWGDNSGLIAQAFNENDFITAWGTILSAISAVNISDTPVMNRFIRDIYERVINGTEHDAKQIVKSDGTAVSLRTAYLMYVASKEV